MKKLFVVLALLLASCGSSTSTTQSSPPIAPPASSPQPSSSSTRLVDRYFQAAIAGQDTRSFWCENRAHRAKALNAVRSYQVLREQPSGLGGGGTLYFVRVDSSNNSGVPVTNDLKFWVVQKTNTECLHDFD